ncbi:GNAT family N-acetyltransferase [Aneurinibacillus tyrosinisolvens]|uniref:GNAT family N-acetyltransferase n=1 Tax=Aneurinibacillus tyrosinisolvens TaxID=1443435 RepID=UPI00063F54C5|nr:GNAT family N-acetyltransferase [Aneurinibacillus tyrosinisolvens]
MSMILKKLETFAELEKISYLERKVWGMDPIPTHQTLTAVKNGGVAIGAFAGEQIVGFLYSFAGYSKGETYLCSHMMGIDPDYQNQGIGYLLKMKQAQEAEKLGYQKIRWTYDPLESRNGYLNIVKLGAICSDYIENCYGEMSDGLNNGLPSDRFNVEWLMTSPYQEQRKRLFTKLSVQKQGVLLDWELREDGLPQAARKNINWAALSNASFLYVPVPTEFQFIKQQDMGLAIDWRLKTREAFTEAFNHHWAVAHIIRSKERPIQHYVLVKRQSLALSNLKKEGEFI